MYKICISVHMQTKIITLKIVISSKIRVKFGYYGMAGPESGWVTRLLTSWAMSSGLFS